MRDPFAVNLQTTDRGLTLAEALVPALLKAFGLALIVWSITR